LNHSPRTIMAHAMRAILLASATAAAKFVRRTDAESSWPDDDSDAHSGCGASFEQGRRAVGRPVINDKHVAA
jgi:hypothetical protein